MGVYDPVCPLEWRYGSNEMRRVFSRENIIRRMIEVEAALMKGLEEAGFAPRGCWERVLEVVNTIDPGEVYRLEEKLGHDIASLVTILAEKTGPPCGSYIHLGATSYDIVDTAWALLLRDGLGIVKRKLERVIERLIELAMRYRDTVMPGRTHGRHALPVTFGFKLANYVYELARSYERILDAEKRVVRGKVAGAVGTMAGWLGRGLIVEEKTLEYLGLEPHAISTQVAPRDGFAELVAIMGILGSQLDRLALEVRELMRDEISEVYFSTGEIGSSAMPHKRNPSIAERVSGLSRVLRGLVVTGLENIPLLHERDLTNSSAERILIPHVFLVVDQMLEDTLTILTSLVANEEKMRKNLEITRGAIMSECLMTKLIVKTGLPRTRVHEALRKITRRALEESKHLREVFLESEYSKYLTKEDIEECFDYNKYLGNYTELIERAVSYAKHTLARDKTRQQQ